MINNFQLSFRKMQDTIVRKKQKLNLYFLTNNYNQKEYLISEKIRSFLFKLLKNSLLPA